MTNLECHNLKEYNTEWRCALPNEENKTAICVKKDTLSSVIRNRNGTNSGDIFTLVMYIKNISFGQANKYIHNVLGLKYEFNKTTEKTNKIDPLSIFKKVKKSRCIVNKDFPVYDDSCLKEYIKMPHINWIREGILPFTCDRFNIGYSLDRNRIVIPWRKWDGTDDEYLGIVGRTTTPNYELLDIPKYFGIVPFKKGLSIYGLNENYKNIIEAGYVKIFESEKSVLKRHSRLDSTGVAIGNCELTDQQVKILISLNVEICLILDEGIGIEHIWKECDKFYPIRKVSYIYDKWGLLKKGSKDSPADLSNKQFEFMFKYRANYDETERKKYKIWREKHTQN